MSLDLKFALVIGVFILCAMFALNFWAKILEIRKNSQRQPPLEDEFKLLLKEMEIRIMNGVKGMIPNVCELKLEFMRELEAKQLQIDRAEARSKEAIAELRSRHEKVIPEIFDQIRNANATMAQCHKDIVHMVARVEGAFENHLQSEKRKG
ncbi:MAG: hypothetical protein ACOYOU_01000 [Kiritimatiellia bacterium]